VNASATAPPSAGPRGLPPVGGRECPEIEGRARGEGRHGRAAGQVARRREDPDRPQASEQTSYRSLRRRRLRGLESRPAPGRGSAPGWWGAWPTPKTSASGRPSTPSFSPPRSCAKRSVRRGRDQQDADWPPSARFDRCLYADPFARRVAPRGRSAEGRGQPGRSGRAETTWPRRTCSGWGVRASAATTSVLTDLIL